MILDQLGRQARDLRISVTDRCNFRCTYCMPFDRYDWLDHKEVLTFEEIARLAAVFIGLGIEKIRLTGGEPLLRRDLPVLVSQLSALSGLKDLCLTTNASLLGRTAADLAAAGLKRVNVSLDTLDRARFRRMSGRDELPNVLEGIRAARRSGLGPIKINSLIERGVNDDEIPSLADFARRNGFAIRFIEFMDVGNANAWTTERMVPKREILEKVNAYMTIRESGREHGSAPSVDYEYTDGSGEVGVIASVSEPFCGACTRVRLTADGKLVTCLFSERGHDLKALLRGGAGEEQLSSAITAIWARRTDRYSEERNEILNSGSPGSRRKFEMITLGG
jgi:cyclic pyranopterin phosphate synthase